MTNKDIRRALMVARRVGRAEGGRLPLLGEPVHEEVMGNEDGQPAQRRWVPQEYAPGALQLRPDDPQTVLKREQVAPVYRSLSHDLLSDPTALGGMKQGNPQQWVNALTKAGAKKEEMDWLGVGEGEPNVKQPRDVVLARAKSRLPDISEKVLGDAQKEQVLISGDEEGESPDLHARWGDSEVHEPDSSWLYDRARESHGQQVDENIDEPSWAQPYLGKALDTFAEDWLNIGGKEPRRLNADRALSFAHEAADNGWVHPAEVAPIIAAHAMGRIDGHEWNDFIDNMKEGFAERFGEKDLRPSPPTLPGIEDPPTAPRNGTSDYADQLTNAVRRLHGFRTTEERGLTSSPEDVSAASLASDYREAAPDFFDHLSDHIRDDEEAIGDHQQQEERWYYEDPESPRTHTVTVEGADGEPDYQVHESYGEYTVHAPNGTRLGTTSRQHEAENLILEHALDHYGSDNGPRYETREIPQGNITVPQAEGRARFESYKLPGLSNYREIPMSFFPRDPDQAFSRSHYDPNTLGHIRVGDVEDEEGRRLLHVDEAQSDWHQKGKEEGYADPKAMAAAKADMEQKRDALNTHREAVFKLLHPNMDFDKENSIHHNIADNAVYGMQPNTRFAGAHISEVLNRMPDDTKAGLFGEDWADQSFADIRGKLKALAEEKISPTFYEDATAAKKEYQSAYNKYDGMGSIPDAPWKDTGDFGKLMLRRALRMAADYGYDGISLSPGWVQSERWGQDHNHLYDNIFGGSLENVAKEANRIMGTDLKTEQAKIPLLKTHGENRGRQAAAKQGAAPAIYFHKDENRDKLRKNSFNLFKRGGAVPTAKDARKAVMIAKRYAEGGAVTPELNELGMYSAATEAAKNLGQARAPAAQMYRTLQKVPGVKQDELDRTGIKDWLDKQPGNVDKEAIHQYLADRELPVKEIISNHPDTRFGPGSGIGEPLPGSKNYKEMRLTMPVQDDGAFYSPNPLHFKEPNILAHARFDDRDGPNGEKLLHVAEIQSDWAKEIQRAAQKAAGEDKQRAKELIRDPAFLKQEGIPRHPYPATWHEFTMKRLARYAAENGYDGLSWDKGETQANRYDLSKQVDALHYSKGSDGNYSVWGVPKGGSGAGRLIASHVEPGGLEKYVGYDMGKKIASGIGRPNGSQTTVDGEDLKIGTEGMKNFYDQIIPAYMNRLAGKLRWNAKTEEVPVGDTTAHAMMFSPEMKQSLMGGVAYKRGGAVRKRYADGGSPKPPMLGEPASEAFLPAEYGPVTEDRRYNGPSLRAPRRAYFPAQSNEELENSVPGAKASQIVAPVYRSVIHDSLSDPEALNQMKNGTPRQWTKALARAGAKPWEIEWMGIGAGEPNVKVPREEMLSRAKANMPQLSQGWMGSEKHKYVSDEPPPAPEHKVEWGRWSKRPLSYRELDKRANELTPQLKEEILADPRRLNNYEDINEKLQDRRRSFLHIGGIRSGWDWDPETSSRHFSGPQIHPDRGLDFVNEAMERGWADHHMAAPVIESLARGRLDPHAWNDLMKNVTGKVAKMAGSVPGEEEPALPGMEPTKPLRPIDHIEQMDSAVKNLLPNSSTAAGVGRRVRDTVDAYAKYEAGERAKEEHEADPTVPDIASAHVKEVHSGDYLSGYRGIKHPDGTFSVQYGDNSEPEHNFKTTNPLEADQWMIDHAKRNYNFDAPPDKEETHEGPGDNITAPEPERGAPHSSLNYRLPELRNYREAAVQFKPKGDDYTGGHYSTYGYPNTIWHTRFGDLKDAQGRRILYNDELQSDWHQKGVHSGYVDPMDAKRLIAAKESLNQVVENRRKTISGLTESLGVSYDRGWGETPIRALTSVLSGAHGDDSVKLRSALYDMYDNIYGSEWRDIIKNPDGSTPDNHRWYDHPEDAKQIQNNIVVNMTRRLHEHGGDMGSVQKQAAEYQEAEKHVSRLNQEIESLRPRGKLPDAPYKKSSELAKQALWHMLRMAADHGHEGLALSPGWVQQQRWVAEDKGHLELYDKIFANAMKKMANEHGLKVVYNDYPALGRHAARKGLVKSGESVPPHYRQAPTILMTPEQRQMIRTSSRNLKTGGRVGYESGGPVNHEPTEAQIEAGNYKKEHVSFQGLDISIENKKGSTRRGVGADGKAWECVLPADYGYIKRTKGADGDHVDVYVGPNKDSKLVFVINQRDHKTNRFDEHKVMLGYDSERDAAADYAKAFSDGKGHLRLGSLHPMSMDAFKLWLKGGKTTAPADTHQIVSRGLKVAQKYLAQKPH